MSKKVQKVSKEILEFKGLFEQAGEGWTRQPCIAIFV
jgi:hypothetical protein